MSCEIILADGTVQLLQITSASFKTWKVWRVQFADGKETVLYKLGTEWMQRNEDHLDLHSLLAIGKCIEVKCLYSSKRLAEEKNETYNSLKSMYYKNKYSLQ